MTPHLVITRESTFSAFLLYLSTANFSTALESPVTLHLTQACFLQQVLHKIKMEGGRKGRERGKKGEREEGREGRREGGRGSRKEWKKRSREGGEDSKKAD